MKPKALVLYGEAINCDKETYKACSRHGFDSKCVLVSDLVSGKDRLGNYDLTVLPGGFSFGDYIAAGRLLGIELQKLGDEIKEYVAGHKLILGICNGFQTMLEADILPGLENKYDSQGSTLIGNRSGRFENRTINLKVNQDSPCIFTNGIESLELPVRHREGQFYAGSDILAELERGEQVVVRYSGPDLEDNPGYPETPNGSVNGIAGICSPGGTVFGLMPHPEAGFLLHHHPDWLRDREKAKKAVDSACAVFTNAAEYCKG